MSVYNKVVLNNEVKIDLSQDTVSDASHIVNGYIGHLNDGTQVTGTGSAVGTLDITENGTFNVANYATASVNVPTSASAISVVDTTDANGGTIREITAVDITDAETALGSDGSDSLDVEISALTTYANSITGASDTDLSSAVATLAAGYGGGGNGTIEELLTNTLTTYSNSTVTSIKTYLFQNTTSLTSVSLPNVTSLGTYAFDGATNLITAYLPKATSMPNYAFNNCTSLENYDFSNITTISGQNCFKGTAFTGVYAPKATVGAFTEGQFQNCTNLVYARFPNHSWANVIRSSTFQNDTALKLADLGSVSTFSVGNVFNGCTALEVLILRRPYERGITALNSTNNFTGCGSETPVKVYVPTALKSTYESATNWATLVSNNQIEFEDLEGSAYEQTDFVYLGVPS